MVESAWSWGSAKNLLRRNPVHGEEEARLVLSESFELLDEQGTSTRMEGSFEMEDKHISCIGL